MIVDVNTFGYGNNNVKVIVSWIGDVKVYVIGNKENESTWKGRRAFL